MTEAKNEYGVVGLGRMGGNLARQALDKGIRVVGFTRHSAPSDMVEAGLVEVHSYEDLKAQLTAPRAIFVYIPAGPAVDKVLDDLAEVLDQGDILVDGGNSYWGDSIRRHQRFEEQGIHFVDLGTSGGVDGARHGACFMAGGEQEAMARVEPILLELAIEDGYVHAGPPGAGHFTKLVHNGIEFGMLQAIGEGVDLLERYRDQLDIAEVLKCWRHGSVIRSWLMDLMEAAYRSNGALMDIPAYVEDTGEVNWLVADIMREDGLEVLLEAQTRLVEQSDDGRIQLAVNTPEGERTLEGSHLLVAAGRPPNTDLLGLEAAGVETDKRGFVEVGERLETNVPGVYAMGDVKGGPAFTHISYDDFRIIRTNLLEGGDATITDRPVPYTVFIDPQLGRIGLSEQEAGEQGRNVRVAIIPMSYVARALEMDEARGFMKAVVDADSGEILGCAILGIEGGEIMAMIQIAMMGKVPYTSLRDAVFAHPTLAESLNTLFATID